VKIEIKTITGKVLYSCEALSVKECLELAVKDEADLTGAYLRGADLRGAYLRGAYLRGAYLTGADLTGADLTGAYLTGAYLTGAYLTGADNEKILIEKQPLQLDTADYYVTIYDNHMSIGCEFHSLGDWFSFDNKRILEMEGKRALSFWKTWKKPIKKVCLAGGRKI